MDDSEIERVLCVMAHPDDVDFGLAGTVANWTDAGIEVSYCMITSGDAGGFDPAVPRDQIAGIREAEQRAAAAEVGVSDVRFLGFPDGQLEVSLDLRRAISRVIREVRPQRVVCQSPERNWERIYASHPDHLAAGEATMCAVYPDSRNQFWFADQLGDVEAWTVPEVWVTAAGKSNRWVDVTKQFERKVAALLSHKSQIASETDLRNLLQAWLGGNAIAAGMPEGTYAEGFWVMSTA
ncbi:MAG TPA: PIG-L deacetylase family protein [Mycobacteriales bacterium]|jgi:LmbE family N-acetylglucosaminyl deacetylase|nr:PIG-L deacetylase family protein [Mycobacteriales bacterium]